MARVNHPDRREEGKMNVKPRSQSAGRPHEVRWAQGADSPLLLAGLLSIYRIYLAILHGALSQLMLSPVYGSLIAADNHGIVLYAGLYSGVILHGVFPALRYRSLGAALPVFAMYLPIIQGLFCYHSDKFGPSAGPLITELATVFPFALSSSYVAFAEIKSTKILQSHSWVAFALLPLLYFAITSLESVIQESLSSMAHYSSFLSRTWLYIWASGLALTQAPPISAALCMPALIYTVALDQHLQWDFATKSFNKSAMAVSWQLERKESNTGYISVLQNDEIGFRLLRCDHSLLGGEWLLSDSSRADGATGTESVYGVFLMLEAVRLIVTPSIRTPPNALVIGLGIGTAPKALLAHGVNTTVVELDPVVHEFATKYFDLPTNHTAYLEDAVSWTQKQEKNGQYDYIIHDVFTGGAEPLALFTTTFLTNLRGLLSVDGALAINYAGDRSLQPTKQVLNTINEVFEGRCRIFRDLEKEESEKDSPVDFVNMVIYCLHPAGQGSSYRPTFRAATPADMLSSLSRRHYLVPKVENELAFPTKEDMESETINVIDHKSVGSFKRAQLESAKRHWYIMRQVIPSEVWETW